MPLPAGLRSLLAQPHFGRLLVTRLMGQTSDGMFQVGLASFVFFSPERQTTAGKVAATFAVLLLPYCVVGPFAGVFLDRWKRERVLVVANLVRSMLVVGTATLAFLGVTGLAFFASALAVLSVNRFILSALSASLPHVVELDRLVAANALSTTAGTVVAIIGGGVAVGVRSIVGSNDHGAAAILVVAAASYVASAMTAMRIPRELLGPDADPDRPETAEALRRVARGITDGAQHLWHHRRAGHALAAIAAHRFFYGLSTISGFLLYRNYFYDPKDSNAGLRGLALVFTASAAGVVVAALITPKVVHRTGPEGWVIGLYSSAVVVELLFGLPFRQDTFVIAAFLLGVVSQGSKICVDSLVQRSIDDAFRGRVFSFYDIVFNVAFVAAAALGAAMLPMTGKSYPVLFIIAGGYGLTAIGYAHASRQFRAAAVS